MHHVLDTVGDNCHWSREATTAHLTRDRAKRWAVEVIHVGVRDQDRVNARQIGYAESWTALAPEKDQAVGEDRVDEQARATGLDEERGMPNEGNSRRGAMRVRRRLRLATERFSVTLAHKTPKLPCLGHPEWNGTWHHLNK
jgi:hypothetical protein